MHDALYTLHDMLYHIWRCSANILKPLVRYLEKVEELSTGKTMSKKIWRYVDGDYSCGGEAREYYQKHGIWDGSWDNKREGSMK